MLTDLRLTIDGAEISRVSPGQLPDLFAGAQLVITGRYARPGAHAIRLRGRVGSVEREYVFDATFPATETAHDFVPKLWATRRVGTLLDEIRRNGAHRELVDEVHALGTEFQIVTPYTSHLVVEDALGGAARAEPRVGTGPTTGSPRVFGPSTPGPSGPSAPANGVRYTGPGNAQPPAPDLRTLAARLQEAGVLPEGAPAAAVEELARQVAREMQRSARDLTTLGETTTGERAVDDSVYLARLLGSANGSDGFFLGGGGRAAQIAALFVRRVGGKVFKLRAGVWIDQAYDARRAPPKTIQVVAFSDDYFALLREQPELARFAALAERMRIVADDTLIDIVPPPPR